MADTERWQKSTRCEANACVEVGHREGGVELRDGKDPDGPRLTFTGEQWAAFLDWTRGRAV